jgi:predicted nucleic acid-binding protein
MICLLDVNALVALGFMEHEFHNRVAVWVRKQQPMDLATCSITELGFVRILSQTPEYGLTTGEACALLVRLKGNSSMQFRFLADTHDISYLPAWVKIAKQITDGHLAQLAKANGGVLATLDRKIPGAFLIPES